MGAIASSYRWRPFALLGLVLLVLAGAACSGGEASPRDRLTACRLLGRAEVAAILADDVDPPLPSPPASTDSLAGRSGCAWSTIDGSRAVLVELVRNADMAPDVRRTGFSAAARFSSAVSRFPDAERIDDVGDGALYVAEAGTLHLLAARSFVTIEVATQREDDARAIALAVAREAVPRLEAAQRAD